MVQHVPVLLKETLEWLDIKPDGMYLDCTGGYGGHSEEILKRLSDKGQLFVCDYHQQTADRLKEKFSNDSRVQVFRERFSQIFEKAEGPFDGILADFGISSPQLEDGELGIGFQVEDAPLDMRIDSRLEKTAQDILDGMPESDLADVFFYYGGERASRRLAKAVIEDRKVDRVPRNTTELREYCERILGRFYFKKKIHPATKVFQALRIAVNRELDEVKALLEQAPKYLALNGRLVLISFHSGEDKMVKEIFRELAQTPGFQMPVRKAVKPGRDEELGNVRSRSARLRVLERVE